VHGLTENTDVGTHVIGGGLCEGEVDVVGRLTIDPHVKHLYERTERSS
jgi:hypothetical protein